MGLQEGVQPVQHQAGLDGDAPRLGIEVEHLVQMLADVDHDGLTDRLAALRGAAAAGQHRNAGLGGDLDRAHDVLSRDRDHHAQGLDLIDRGVSAVTAAAESVEQDLAFNFMALNLAVDLTYAALDPRIRLGSER